MRTADLEQPRETPELPVRSSDLGLEGTLDITDSVSNCLLLIKKVGG